MDADVTFWIRVFTLFCCVVGGIFNGNILLTNQHKMLGAQYMRFWSLIGFQFSIGWGTVESMLMEVPGASRIIVVATACLLAAIASGLPKQYQQNFDQNEPTK